LESLPRSISSRSRSPSGVSSSTCHFWKIRSPSELACDREEESIPRKQRYQRIDFSNPTCGCSISPLQSEWTPLIAESHE
jgi:hypothetical protein